MRPLVYLDYAATSAIRPECVVEAVAAYLRDVGATPGRGGHRRALDAGRVMLRCRRALAELLSLPGDPGRIAFQFNATHALNTALLGLLRAGDRVVRTVYDHNAVRRPVGALARRGVDEYVLSGSAAGGIDLDEAERALAERPTRLLVLPHGSNVLGTLLPVRELTERAHAAGAWVLLDAAQTLGHLDVAVGALGVDLLAFTGHKGLLGPQGTGGLWVREGVPLEPLLRGGTGGDSAALEMPDAYPDHLEAGTQNAPGIAGLLAGAEWVRERGPGALHAQSRALKARLLERLRSVGGLTVRSPAAPEGLGMVTLTSAALPSAELARRLDVEYGVQTRAGLHCAPETHELLGTERDGAVRFSFGWASSEADADAAADALAALCGNAPAAAAVRIAAMSTEPAPGCE